MALADGGEKSNLVTWFTEEETDNLPYGFAVQFCQTFTITAQTVFHLFVAKRVIDYRPEDQYFTLYNTDVAGKPTGAPIAEVIQTSTDAKIDGKSRWRRVFFPTFPILAPGLYAMVLKIPWPHTLNWPKWACRQIPELYPDGKAWKSSNFGATWTEIPNTDFLFEVWGWTPPPDPPPDPVISNWAPLTIASSYRVDGLEIVITTDIPVHLYMRWTTEEPLKHPQAEYRRGILVPIGTRYCFVAWEENEQLEPGDTLIHTFLKDNWPVCQTRWFYFIGTKQAEEQPSASPIFVYHRGEPPYGWHMDTFNSIEPQLISGGAAGAWTERDASKYVHPDATGIILQLINRDPGVDNYVGVRAKGSTLQHTAVMRRNSQTWAICGLDADKRFETYLANPGWQDFWVMGFTGRNVHFFVDPVDYLPAVAGVYTDCDIHAIAPQAVAAIFSMGAATTTARNTSIRKKGSTDDRYWPTFHIYPIIGLDLDGRCQVKVSHILPLQCQVWCIGYIDSLIVTETNGRLVPAIPAATWTSVPLGVLLPNPRYAVLELHQTIGSRDWGVQKNDSLRQPLYPEYFKEWIYVHLDDGNSAQFYRQDPSVNFYVIAEIP